MADPELEEIRKQRLAQMQSQYKGGNDASQQHAEQAQRQQQVEDMKNSILSQVLDQAARARLNTLTLGKPEKGKMIENFILAMAQRGQISGRLGEEEFIGILENINKQTAKKTTTVKFDRRRAALDSDDEL